MALRIGGGAFSQGLQLGRGIFNDAEANRRANAEESRRQQEFQWRSDAEARAAQDRADLGYVAQGGATGITPNMTQPDANGVGPVASPADVDIRYRGLPPSIAGAAPAPADPSAVGATTPLPTAAAGAVPPTTGLPTAAPAAPMAPSDQTAAIGKIALRGGNVQGFYAAQDRAKEQKFQEGYDKYAKSLMEMSNSEFEDHIHKLVTDNPKAPAKLKYDPKTMTLTVEHDDGSTQQMTRAQAMTHLMSAYEMGNGKVDKGLQTQLALYQQRRQELMGDTQQNNLMTEAVGRQDLAAKTSKRQDELALAKIELERQQGNRMAAIAARGVADRWAPQAGLVDAQGQPLLINTRTGETKPMLGVRALRDPTSDIATRAEIQKRAEYYLNGQMKNDSGPNKGKPMNADEAMQRAMQDFPNAPSTQGTAGGGMTDDQVKAALGFLRDGQARTPSPTGGRTSQNTTIPPMPPQMVMIGGMQQINPDYVDWQRQYGDVGTLEGGPTPLGALGRPSMRDLARQR